MKFLNDLSRGPRVRSSRYLPHSNKRQAQRLARQLAAGQLRFFDHDANRAQIAEDDGELFQLVAEVPFTGGTPISTEIPDGLKEGDVEWFRAWFGDSRRLTVLPSGSTRDRLRNAGLIEYVGKRWVVTKHGRAILDRR